MNKKMKIAFIEVGHFHSGIFTGYIKNTPHEIVAISDRDKDIAKEKGKALNCRVYTDYRKLLKDEEIDFVFSFGRHNEMAEIIDSILERGIPLCTEKPITDNLQVMIKLANKAKEKNLFTDVALPLRFSPVILAINKLKTKVDIGEVIHCYFRNMAGPIQRYIDWNNSWMIEKEFALGGPFMNEGSHYIDLFRYLAGEEVSSVYACMNNRIYGKSIDDNFSTVLETSSGKRGIIEICYGYPTDKNWRDFACVINTTDYLFTVIDREEPREFKLEIRCRKDNSVKIVDLMNYEQKVYHIYINEMIQRYLTNQPGVIPFDYFCGTVKVLEAAYQSAKDKRLIETKT